VDALDDIANEVARLESRVSDVIFDTVRAQLASDDDGASEALERRLSKVRRSLLKAEALLRGGTDF